VRCNAVYDASLGPSPPYSIATRIRKTSSSARRSPIATSLDTESLIGFLCKYPLVLRVRLSTGMTFRELLRQVRRTALEAYAHQDLPFEKLVEELQPERTLSHSPLFQVMFHLQNAVTESLSLSGLSMSQLEVELQTAKFDLSLSMAESEEGLIGTFNYNTDLFDQRLSSGWRGTSSVCSRPQSQTRMSRSRGCNAVASRKGRSVAVATTRIETSVRTPRKIARFI
jgi:hypothetical protein